MQPLQQKHMDELDLLARRFNCEFCLPPSKNGLHPFFYIENIQDLPNVVFDFSNALTYLGYSFVFSDENNIEIIGVTDDEFYRLSGVSSFYGNIS